MCVYEAFAFDFVEFVRFIRFVGRRKIHEQECTLHYTEKSECICPTLFEGGGEYRYEVGRQCVGKCHVYDRQDFRIRPGRHFRYVARRHGVYC